MVAKINVNYKCLECDTVRPTWSGRCSACGAWGSLEKFESGGENVLSASLKTASVGNVVSLDSVKDKRLIDRFKSGLDELDRCLGGGVVPGSVILLGGDPGVGKSTLALQLAFGLQKQNLKVLYVAGEESPAQVKLRADRLGGNNISLEILPDTNLQTILATVIAKRPNFLILDSIQTIYNPEGSGIPGSVSQVSGAGARLVELAKQHNIATLLIGHVTKEGYIAGPKTLEHIVDVVLYLEGERFHQLRLLRAVKNRFGGVNEVGVFEMADLGLQEVINPSHLFWDKDLDQRSGTALFPALEGSRVMVCEIQALLSKSNLAYPKRTAIGFDVNRLWLILAVIAKYAKLPVLENDVYVNVAGGLRINEPAVDLALVAAMISSFLDKPLGSNIVFLGELGLSGEVRSVSQIDKRLKEAEKLGFDSVVVSTRQNIGKTKTQVIRVSDIKEFSQKLFGSRKKD